MKFFYCLAFFILYSCPVHSFESDEQVVSLNNYEGDIGQKYQIGMTLIFRGNEVSGTYFYNKHLQDIKLTGEIIKGNQIALKEYDDNGGIVATFEGVFIKYANQDPRKTYGDCSSELDKEIIVGKWKKITEKETLPFYLNMSSVTHRLKGSGRYSLYCSNNDTIIEKSAQSFLKLIKYSNKKGVSKLISYPINVRTAKKTYKINNASEFIAKYDNIFTPTFKQKIAKSIPHNMFVNYAGVALGDGEIWFGCDGKVIDIDTRPIAALVGDL